MRLVTAGLADQRQAFGVASLVEDDLIERLGLERHQRPVARLVLGAGGGAVGGVRLRVEPQAAPAEEAQVAAELAVAVEGAAARLQGVRDGGERGALGEVQRRHADGAGAVAGDAPCAQEQRPRHGDSAQRATGLAAAATASSVRKTCPAAAGDLGSRWQAPQSPLRCIGDSMSMRCSPRRTLTQSGMVGV